MYPFPDHLHVSILRRTARWHKIASPGALSNKVMSCLDQFPATCTSGAAAPCQDCFKLQTNGGTVTLDGNPVTITCPLVPGGLTQMTHCSGFVDASAFGASCQAICNHPTNTGVCDIGFGCYCSLHNANPDCMCVAPDNTCWARGESDEICYDTLAKFVQDSGMSSVPPRCVYQGCDPAAGNVLIPSSIKLCPHPSVFCTVSDNTFTLTDVFAQRINLIEQNCGLSSSTNDKPGKGTQSSVAKITTTDKIIIGVSTAVVGILIVLAIVLASIFAHQRRLLKKAQYRANVLLDSTSGQPILTSAAVPSLPPAPLTVPAALPPAPIATTAPGLAAPIAAPITAPGLAAPIVAP